MLIFYLVMMVIAIPVGAAIALILQGHQKYFGHIFGLTAGAVLGVVLIMMLHLYEALGIFSIVALWGGFFLFAAVERFTTAGHSDTGKRPVHTMGLILTLLGLSLHSVFDGVNLVVAAREEHLGGALAIGLILHRLPIGTVISIALLRNLNFVKSFLCLIPLMIGPAIGVELGEQLLRNRTFAELTDYVIACAVGSLLHVVMEGFRGKYVSQQTGQTGLNRSAKLLFVIGFVLTFCVIYLFQGPEGGHAH